MSRLMLIFAIGMALASSAFASLTTCPTGPYTLYLVPNFTCTSGDLTFSNFGYTPTGNPSGIAIPASAIAVTPITTNANEGFQFAGGWSVATQSNGMSSFQDSLISFTVTTAVPAITDLHLFFNGSFTGTGIASTAESFCENHALVGCPSGSGGSLNVSNPPGMFNDMAVFAPVQSVTISKDINVTSGVNGTAAISQVINTFSTPEPWSFFLLGSGLLWLGLWRRRTKRT